MIFQLCSNLPLSMVTNTRRHIVTCTCIDTHLDLQKHKHTEAFSDKKAKEKTNNSPEFSLNSYY